MAANRSKNRITEEEEEFIFTDTGEASKISEATNRFNITFKNSDS